MSKSTPVHHFFVHLTSPLLALFPWLHLVLLSFSISDVLRQVCFQILTVFLIANVKFLLFYSLYL